MFEIGIAYEDERGYDSPPDACGIALITKGDKVHTDCTCVHIPRHVLNVSERLLTGNEYRHYSTDYQFTWNEMRTISPAAFLRWLNLAGFGAVLFDEDYRPLDSDAEPADVYGVALCALDDGNGDPAGMLSEWTAWSAGEVFFWFAKNEDGETVDTCHGYYGLDGNEEYMRGEARDAVEYEVELRTRRAKEAADKAADKAAKEAAESRDRVRALAMVLAEAENGKPGRAGLVATLAAIMTPKEVAEAINAA